MRTSAEAVQGPERQDQPELVGKVVDFRRGERFRFLPQAEPGYLDAEQAAREIRSAVFPAMRRVARRQRLRARASKWAPRAYALFLLGFFLSCQAVNDGFVTIGLCIGSAFAGALLLIGVLILEDEPAEAGRVIGRGQR
jgi:hypothetical protein